MKKITLQFFIITAFFHIAYTQNNNSQNKKPQFDIEMFDSSDKIVPLKKKSITIGKCCQVGKALSKISGGRSDVYLTQS